MSSARYSENGLIIAEARIVREMGRTRKEQQLDIYRRKCAAADRQYAEWLECIAAVPAPIEMLTEDQWMDAVAHFNGCAICDSPNIDTRLFFIRYEDGGKYAAWNMLPACEECELSIKKQFNPFRRLNQHVNRNVATGRGVGVEKLAVIAAYLGAKMKEAMR